VQILSHLKAGTRSLLGVSIIWLRQRKRNVSPPRSDLPRHQAEGKRYSDHILKVRFLTILQKSHGDASTSLPCPGPSATFETETGLTSSAQAHPTVPDPGLAPSTSSLTQIGHYRYLWDSPAWPAGHHPPHTPPAFLNPLPTYPTFPPVLLTQAPRAVNLDHNATASTTPVPLSCHVTQSTQSQPLANTTDPSLRSPSPPSNTGSETEDTPSRPKSVGRIRISRRNPIHGFVEGAMAGNQEHGKAITNLFCLMNLS